MDIKEAVRKAYENLPDGGKSLAWAIYGTTSNYFKKIVDGGVVDIKSYYKALDAIKKAANKCKTDTDCKVAIINNINIRQEQNRIQ